MRVVVTGAAGFIGSRLANVLLDDGVPVIGVDRAGADKTAEPRLARAWAQLTARPGFHGCAADLVDDYAAVRAAVQDADAVVHLAGRPGTHASWTEYPAYLRDNVAATARLAEACIAAGVPRLIHASSSSVYGRIASGHADKAALRPVSPYGTSKLAAESTLHAYADSRGLPVVIVRMFSVYGPGQRPDMGVYAAIAAALGGTPFAMHGDGAQTRSMTYVDDVVAGLRLAMAHGRSAETYDLGGAPSVSLLEVLDEVRRLVGCRPQVVGVPDPPGNQRHTAADLSKASLELGYAPKVGVSEGLRRQVAWQRAAH
ncbi:MAG: putative nucleotide sugar epimerase [Pseudonocardiales bacterium]|nr:putative nucleotide sugar epimerase [Pseudonocardiales bacterium]